MVLGLSLPSLPCECGILPVPLNFSFSFGENAELMMTPFKMVTSVKILSENKHISCDIENKTSNMSGGKDPSQPITHGMWA